MSKSKECVIFSKKLLKKYQGDFSTIKQQIIPPISDRNGYEQNERCIRLIYPRSKST